MCDKLLSVIVLTYKHGELLHECLESIFIQDYQNVELIVAEDGALDFDKDNLEKFIADIAGKNIVRTQIIVNPTNIGTVANINNAIDFARGDYIKIIAGDDSFPNSQVFTEQVKYLENHPDKFFVLGDIVECDYEMNSQPVNEKKEDKRKKALLGKTKKLLKYFCKKDSSLFATQALCFRKEFFSEYEKFDQRFKLIEDLPLGIRIIKQKISFGYISVPCINHRGSVGISTSSNAFDKKRLVYYNDIKMFYEEILFPIKKEVGRIFVNMRYGIAKFRIDYTKKEKSKLKLVLKYFFPLCYYVLTKPQRVKFFTGKNK